MPRSRKGLSMQSERKFPMLIPIIAVLALILGLGGLLVIRTAEQSRNSLPILDSVPSFEAVNQDGTPFGLQSLRGKISIVDFMFTNCPGICPVMSANMAALYNLFAPKAGCSLSRSRSIPTATRLRRCRNMPAALVSTTPAGSFSGCLGDRCCQSQRKGF